MTTQDQPQRQHSGLFFGLPPRDPALGDPDFGRGPRYHLLTGRLLPRGLSEPLLNAAFGAEFRRDALAAENGMGC